jgi:hypothetical protein
MAAKQKTDFCDACYAPWYPRLFDADAEPMENLCDDCAEMMDEIPTGATEDDERPPICSCGVTMMAHERDDGTFEWYCANDECPYYEEEDDQD